MKNNGAGQVPGLYSIWLLSDCVQHGGSTISGPRLITKKYPVADGMLSPVTRVRPKLVKQCEVYVCHYWSAPLTWMSVVFHWLSNSQNAVQLQHHSGCWDLDGNNINLFLPICLLGTITRGALRLYIQQEAILNSVPSVTAQAS